MYYPTVPPVKVTTSSYTWYKNSTYLDVVIGSQDRLKLCWTFVRVGSNPIRGTKLGDFVDNPEGNMLTKREWCRTRDYLLVRKKLIQ